jgi:hypothetical protein
MAARAGVIAAALAIGAGAYLWWRWGAAVAWGVVARYCL